MCGIGCLLFECSSPCLTDSAGVSSWEQELSAVLQRRGGDTSTRSYSFPTELRKPNHVEDKKAVIIETKLLSSVLHLRGETIVPQPLQAHVDAKEITTSGTALRSLVLCWNGECYDLSTTDKCVENVAEAAVADGLLRQNDTELLLRKLKRAIIMDANVTEESQASWSSNLRRCISNVFRSVKGEYAFILSVLLNDGHSYTFFGRDPLGRKSLLIQRYRSIDQNHKSMAPFTLMQTYQLDLSREVFILSSVAPFCSSRSGTDAKPSISKWIEVPPGRLFCFDVPSGVLESIDISQQMTGSSQTFQLTNRIISPTEEAVLPIDGEITPISQMMLTTARKLHHLLNAAVRRRVLHVPQRKVHDKVYATNVRTTSASVGILFSGGLDSVVLAALCHSHIPPNDPIDLINVAFYDDLDSKNVTNGVPLSSAAVAPDRAAALESFYEMTTRFATRKFNFIAVDVTRSEVMVERQRILTLIKPLSTHMDFNIGSAMWFASRGVGRVVSPIPKWETISTPRRMQSSSQEPTNESVSGNLSQNSNKNASSSKIACSNVQCPRRAHSTCIFQSCTFCCSYYRKKISSFLGGSATGVCHVHNSSSRELHQKNRSDTDKGSVAHGNILPYSPQLSSDACVISGAKVLLVGIGADEQMAGYGRHRAVYKRGGYRALRMELSMEMDRLWQRNLGRDDRCISDHGREARFPFLDEDLVSFLAAESLECICDLDQRQGVGDKMILRIVARMIGVTNCSVLVKRAIQFGSRIAKISEANCFISRRQASGSAIVVND